MDETPDTGRPRRPYLLLALAVAALYLPAVWNRDLWSPDEPRYAEVAREMLARGDYILPHLNGATYAEKPPLFFWLGIAAGQLPGVPFESGTRLVATLAAFGTLALTFRLGRRLAGSEAGWLAAMVLGTSSMFVLEASSGVIDGTLTFLVAAAISCGLAARESHSFKLWAAFYLLAGAAVLTKGPVGFAIPAGVLLLLALQEDGLRALGAAHPLWGVPLVVAVAALWVVPAIDRGGAGYAETILFKQSLGRAWRSFHHEEPFHYFLRVFPGSFLPWIVALPSALWAAIQARKADRGSRIALSWFVFTFVFFSAVSGKKTRYLLPLFPAASLLVSFELLRARRWRARAPLVFCGLVVVVVGLALAVVGLGFAEPALRRIAGLAPEQLAGLLRLSRVPTSLAYLLPGFVLAALGAIAAVRAVREPQEGRSWAVAALVTLIGWAQWVGAPTANLLKSSRPLAQVVAQAAGTGGAVALYRNTFAGVFTFYLARNALPVLGGPDEVGRFIDDHPTGIVLATSRDFELLRSRLDTLEALACRRVGAEILCAAQPQQVALALANHGP